LLPLPVIDNDMKYFKELGFHGFDFPLASVGIWTKSLPIYTIASKCWNLDVNATKIVSEYFELYYGKQYLFAKKAARKQMEAFSNNRYGGCYRFYNLVQGNFSISWYEDFWKPEKLLKDKKENIELMKEATAASLKLLSTALNEAETGLNQSEEAICKTRFKKLCTAIKQVILEQEFLNTSALLAGAIAEFREAGGKHGESSREKITDLYFRLKQAFAGLKNNSSPENDAQGLLWFGEIWRRFEKAFVEWEKIVCLM